MNTNSNSYTIIYASVMVVIVAFLLAFVSSSLKDIQNKKPGVGHQEANFVCTEHQRCERCRC